MGSVAMLTGLDTGGPVEGVALAPFRGDIARAGLVVFIFNLAAQAMEMDVQPIFKGGFVRPQTTQDVFCGHRLPGFAHQQVEQFSFCGSQRDGRVIDHGVALGKVYLQPFINDDQRRDRKVDLSYSFERFIEISALATP